MSPTTFVVNINIEQSHRETLKSDTEENVCEKEVEAGHNAVDDDKGQLTRTCHSASEFESAAQCGRASIVRSALGEHCSTIFFFLFSSWKYVALLRRIRGNVSNGQTRTLALFLGSGGHTSEALALVSTLDASVYTPRKYIISEGDTLSAQKAIEVENSFNPSPDNIHPCEIIFIPRARRVHQSLFWTPPTALKSLLSALILLIRHNVSTERPFADVLVLNGPGTCFTISFATYITKLLGFPIPKIIYVESFARVKSLSLSGKLLRPFVDRFIVQWSTLLKEGQPGECHGWLV